MFGKPVLKRQLIKQQLIMPLPTNLFLIFFSCKTPKNIPLQFSFDHWWHLLFLFAHIMIIVIDDHAFPCTILQYVMASKKIKNKKINLYHSAQFVNEYILRFLSHNQLHRYGFSAFRQLRYYSTALVMQSA